MLKKIEAIIREDKVSDVKDALADIGIMGLNIFVVGTSGITEMQFFHESPGLGLSIGSAAEHERAGMRKSEMDAHRAGLNAPSQTGMIGH